MSKTMAHKKMAGRTLRGMALLAAVGLLSQAQPVSAQGDAATASQRKALSILDRGIEAAGGWEAVANTKTFSERMSLVQTRRGQEVRPGADAAPEPARVYTFSADSDLRSFVAQVFPSDTASAPAGRIVRTSGKWRMIRTPQNTVADIDDPALVEGIFSVATFAPDVLRAARQQAATLRYKDRADGPQGPEESITFAGDDGLRTTLAFSARTGRMLRVERPREHPLFGDLTLRVAFDDFRPAGDLVAPYRITADLPDVFHVEGTCSEIVPGAPLDSSLLQPPEGARPDPRVSSSGKQVVEPFPGVHHLLNIVQGYNALYVEQPEGVFVIEAPGGLSTSEEILAAVAARVPGKPVRGLVLTHHHYDHAAGLWTYIERGIPIITTPGNRAFVETVAAAPRTMDGGHAPARAKVELVEGRRTIGSGPNRFELINVGPNPHADEILIAYFPERRMMYVPDIYGYFPGFTPPPLLLSFAERLDSLNLDVQTVLTAHTDPDTMEGLKRMVQRARGAR
jgi:hypothetical protein